MSDFARIKAVLRDWPAVAVPDEPFADLPLERLRKALNCIDTAGPCDIASLIRHVLRCETVQHRIVQTLTMPCASPFPSREQWADCGCKARDIGDGKLEVEAQGWEPEWLHPLHVHEATAEPFRAVEEGNLRRPKDLEVPTDPALRSNFKHTHNLSPSQAEIIRGVMLSPSGAVRLVILPTGGGKSLVGLSAALLGHAESGGVSVIVVPTIALAYDQVTSARIMCPNQFIDAWEGGMKLEDKRAIRERLKAGTQRLLFAAPESIVGALSGELYGLAERGALRAFIVDEAHLVGQWGASFRPEFQSMSALWRNLRDHCPAGRIFRTLLMTATLTEETFEDLNIFFGPLGPSETLAAVHLRPEPDYFQAHCKTKDEKISRVLETLREGPRPAILYITTKADARTWHQRCLDEGWKRTGIVHGESSSAEREAAVTAWRDDKLDLMVATSAFGLGMDKGDVRLVLHACVPETVDRFYQEVGRGGRDGHPCVSILLWTDQDKQMASRMSSPAIISNELGLDRWRSMWNDPRTRHDGELTLLHLRAKRSGLQWDSDDNEKWNLRTLLLLARSGVLEVKHRRVPDLAKETDESDESFEERREEHWGEYAALSPVRLRRYNPSTENSWNELVAHHRQQSQALAGINWLRMEAILSGRSSLEQVLQELYRVPAAGIHHVAVDPHDVTMGASEMVCCEVNETLQNAINGPHSRVIITYKTRDSKESSLARSLVETLKRVAVLGIREFALPHGWRDQERWLNSRPNPLEEMLRGSPEKFIVLRDVEQGESQFSSHVKVPRLSLVPPDHATRPIPEDLLFLNRPLHVILAPEECPDHIHPLRCLSDGPHMRLENFYRLLFL